MDFDPDYVSQVLCDARKQNVPLDDYPSALPGDLTLAYEVQSHSIKRWDDAVIGWKVGGVNSPYRETYNVQRLAGPAFSRGLRWAQSGECVDMPVFSGGFAAVEAELVIELADTSGVDPAALTVDSVWDVIAAVYIGVEIASSPMADINRIGPIAIVSDFGNNAGLVVGPRIEAQSAADLSDANCKTYIEGELVGEASPPKNLDGPLGAVKFLLGLLQERNLPVPEGTLVTTGAITGIHDIAIGQASVVDFGSLGKLGVRAVAVS